MHKCELIQNAKAVSKKSYLMNLKYAKVVKIKLEKFFESQFILPLGSDE